jgi:3-oxoacyl-[acyl-carrier protein] reductase
MKVNLSPRLKKTQQLAGLNCSNGAEIATQIHIIMRKYLLIGGSRGIGAETAKLLSEQGDQFYMISRSEPPVFSGLIQHYEADVLEDDLESVFQTDELDGMVYFPGSINLKPFRGLEMEDFESDLAINLKGAVKCLKAYFSALKKGKDPSVVLYSTVAVGQGMPFHASVAAAKGAVEGLTRSLAAEWAPTIRVNAIAPSLTDTDLAAGLLDSDKKRENAEKRHPLRRVGKTKDIANLTGFLLSDRASWISGQVLGVDGGLSTLKI